MRGGCCGGGGCSVWLGVEVQKLSDQLAEYFKVKDGEGVLVATVIEASPAAKAGIKAGDIITKIGDEEVENRADLLETICDKKAGDEVSVTYLRDGQKREAKVVLAQMPEEYMSKGPGKGRGFMMWGPEELGFDLDDLGPAIERQMEMMPEHLEGSMEEMQKQLDNLSEELEKLKLKLENK
jgi:serine protease Do